ncbi:hypothetical protein B0H66DRAFT_338919 [Apodospora peruviana]|uniref:ER membrane protein complex subunit 7 beta-sandwich domain-containing protein n=1 Tax=Apodospora peruviana TaxID=516989 RepID=A0AAE0M115_9PEZI|nr:hypothetical protein B0H66DRAFT_338919 [Apodospora peruviana]
MRLLSTILGVCAALLATTTTAFSSSASSHNSQETQKGQGQVVSLITLRIPASNAIPNPYVLSPSTHATLSTFGQPRKTAWLSTANTFVLRDLPPGSYLVEFCCVTHAFAPLRLDVDSTGGVKVWETYRGHDWGNKGEAVKLSTEGVYDVRVLGTKGYFMERAKFNFFSILRNPMVLLGVVSMGIFLGMPYLVDNMDPEMRAEWEERQKTNPMNGIMGAATGQAGAPNPVGNFDMAAFLAGSSKKEDSGPATITEQGEQSGGGGGGGSRKNKKGKGQVTSTY